VRVTVVAPRREGGFDGYWAAGKHWPEGKTDAELTREEIARIVRNPGLVVIDGSGNQLKPAKNKGPARQSVQVTQDELAELEKFRAQRAQARQSAQAEESPLFEAGDKVNESEILSRPSTIGTPGGFGPLQNADILQGGTPPTAESVGTTTPLETRTELAEGNKHGKRK
jgi:hypothetical protein